MLNSKCLICGTEGNMYKRPKTPGVCGKCYLENKKMILKGYWHMDKELQSDINMI